MTRFLTELNEPRMERRGMRTSTTRPALVVRLTRFRVVALAVVGLLTLVAGISTWRMRSADELPDVGDPFDVALGPIVIPDRDNAYSAYAEARIALSGAPKEFWDSYWKAQTVNLIWSKAKPEVRSFQQKNRASLEIWREGSERPDALYHQPSELAFDTILPLLQEVFLHSGMAALEGSRLEERGAMAEAWAWYRAMLRSSRLVGRHGALVERRYGAHMHELAARCILRWAADPRVNARMLRRALDEVLAADQLTPPLSDVLKLEYLMASRELDELRTMPREIPLPGGDNGLLNRVPPSVISGREIQRFRFRASNDPEKSRRALRLVFANWLAQVDRPAAERARSATHAGLLIYEADRAAPPAARAVTPDALSAAIDHTILARWMFRPDNDPRNVNYYGSWEGDGVFARERRRRSVLLVKLAAELYCRDRVVPPADIGALLDSGYLEKLPEGITRDERMPDATAN
jgi:hypothetical protein